VTGATTPTSDSPAPAPGPARPAHRAGGDHALAGAAAASFALGFGYLLAAAYEEPSPVDNVATAVIDHAPAWLVDAGISLFGTNDKLVLGVTIVVIVVGLGALLGRWARTRTWPVPVAYGSLATVGLLAARDRPDARGGLAVVVLAVSSVAAIGLHLALRGARRAAEPHRPGQPAALERRWFLGLASGAAVVAAGSALWARAIVREMASAAREAVGLPRPRDPAAPLPAAASVDVPGITPIVTPNGDFYRIDTAFVTPRIDPQEWTLTVHGHVEEPVTLTYGDLLAMPMVERYVTLACVSNEVGGDLVGNAKWLGVPLADVLALARPTEEAQQVVGRSVDGFTAGFPIELASDGRDALVAVGMNDEPLPFAHGFPARLVVEGVYGYVSATKWLAQVELTTWDGFDGYWIPRGWAKEAPIKTQSRIDVPRRGRVPAGPTVVAGVAWAQGRGISVVEVRVDGGAWQRCELSAPISDATWRQWRTTVDLAPGEHVIEARATDGDGVPQTSEYAPPAPDGATGYPVRAVDAVA
jgi:DMSO/TMAO reductase YedYZ molybdopterin-dependent catalytic subunit